MLSDALQAVATGAALAASFNPLASLIASPLAALMTGGKRRPPRRRTGFAAAVLAAGWLAGDGFRILGLAHQAYASAAGIAEVTTSGWTAYLTLAIWGSGSIVAGYLLPVWAGVFVGRRVIHGTGWASAAWVAGSASITLSMLASVL